MVRITSSSRKPTALCSVGQIRGPVWPSPIFMASPINMNLAKHQGLDDGKAPRCEFDACGVQHRGLHRNHRAEGNVEVDGQDQEFLDLVSGALLQCRLRGGLDCHDGLSYLGFPQGIVVRTIPYRPPQANNKELS